MARRYKVAERGTAVGTRTENGQKYAAFDVVDKRGNHRVFEGKLVPRKGKLKIANLTNKKNKSAGGKGG